MRYTVETELLQNPCNFFIKDCCKRGRTVQEPRSWYQGLNNNAMTAHSLRWLTVLSFWDHSPCVEMRPRSCSGTFTGTLHPSGKGQRLPSALTGCIQLPRVQTSTEQRSFRPAVWNSFELPCEILVLKNRHAPELNEANTHARLIHSKQLLKNIHSMMWASFCSLTAITPKNAQNI